MYLLLLILFTIKVCARINIFKINIKSVSKQPFIASIENSCFNMKESFFLLSFSVGIFLVKLETTSLLHKTAKIQVFFQDLSIGSLRCFWKNFTKFLTG